MKGRKYNAKHNGVKKERDAVDGGDEAREGF